MKNIDKKLTDKTNVYWRVHTPNLLKELLNNESTWIFISPLRILGDILYELGTCAARINDEELNKLMLRLTIYSAADPESPDYDKEIVDKYLGGNK